MATKLVHSQIPPPQILPYSISSPPKMLRSQSQRTPSSSSILSIHGRIIGFRPISTIKVAEQSANLVGEKEEEITSEEPSSQPRDLSINRIKAEIDKVLLGINRGIFGIPSKRKSEIEGLVKLLEPLNPNPRPTVDLEKLSGCWKLIYSTITILGSKRTKLGLRDFISLGDFFQVIDVTKMKAVNVIKFNVRGLNLFNGKLIIEASFKISSESRVDIRYNTSTILPDQLMNMFCKNYDLLLGIFNPDGWLEITYVDDTLRIGRDDKGNIFILERSQETNP